MYNTYFVHIYFIKLFFILFYKELQKTRVNLFLNLPLLIYVLSMHSLVRVLMLFYCVQNNKYKIKVVKLFYFISYFIRFCISFE